MPYSDLPPGARIVSQPGFSDLPSGARIVAPDSTPPSFNERFGSGPPITDRHAAAQLPDALRLGAGGPLGFYDVFGTKPAEAGTGGVDDLTRGLVRKANWVRAQRGMPANQGPVMEFPNAPEAGGSFPAQAALGQFLTSNPKAQIDILQRYMPGTGAKQDHYGYWMVKTPGSAQWAYLNKPGFSAQDVFQTLSMALKYAPAGAISQAPATALGRIATAGAVAGGTNMMEDVAAQGLGSKQPVNWGNVALTGATAAGAQALFGEVGPKLVRAVGRKLGIIKPATSVDMEELASRQYAAGNAAGLRVAPQSFDDEVQQLMLLASQKGVAVPGQRGGYEQQFPETIKALAGLSNNTGLQHTIESLDQARQALGYAAMYGRGKDKYVANLLLDHFDDYLNVRLPSIPGAIISGDPAAAAQAYNSARAYFRAAKQTQVVEQALLNAEASASTDTTKALQRQFQAIVRNPRRLAQFDPAMQAQIKQIAGGGSWTGLIKLMRSYADSPLATVGTFAVTGPYGVAATQAAKLIGNFNTRDRTSQLLDQIALSVGQRAQMDSKPLARYLVPGLAAGTAYATRQRF